MSYSDIKKAWKSTHYYSVVVDYPDHNPFQDLDWLIYKHYPSGKVERTIPCCDGVEVRCRTTIACCHQPHYRKVKVTVLASDKDQLEALIVSNGCTISEPLYYCADCDYKFEKSDLLQDEWETLVRDGVFLCYQCKAHEDLCCDRG